MSKKNLIERLKKLSNKQLEEILRNYNVNAIDTFLDVLVKEQELKTTVKENLTVDEKAIINFVKNNNVAIHCPSEEYYNKFTKMLEKNGETWSSGSKFSERNFYKIYEKLTCIGFNYFQEWGYSSLGGLFYNEIKPKILTVKELFDKFKIEKKEEIKDIEYDKKTGRVIEINNYKSHNYIFIVSDGFFLDANPIENYSRDYLDFIVYIGLAYISKETCDKAKQEMIKKVEEENKKIGAKC